MGHWFPQAPQFAGSKLVFAWQLEPSVPASSTTQVSLVGSHEVPAGQGAPFAHETLLGSPSSPWREEREHPAKTAATARRTAA